MDDKYILPSDKVKVYRMGGRIEIGTNLGNRNPTKRKSKLKYIDNQGVEHDYVKSSENRSDNLASVRKSMKRLNRLIEHNFHGFSNELWVTLTYRENVRDEKKVYNDYKAFMRKLRRLYDDIEYISVLEPQERGAWHIHALFKSEENEQLYIDQSILEKKWKHGYVWVKKLTDTDNVAAYVTSYLTNLKVDGKGKGKKIEKGGRLHLYPANMNFYRHSRGIKQPEEYVMTKERVFRKFQVKTSAYAPDYLYSYDYETPSGMTGTHKCEYFRLTEVDGVRIVQMHYVKPDEIYNKSSLSRDLKVSVRTFERYLLNDELMDKAITIGKRKAFKGSDVNNRIDELIKAGRVIVAENKD